MYKILIIEDDLTMAQAIQKEMKMWGNDAQYVMSLVKLLHFLRISFCSTSHFHFLMATTGAARLGKYRTYR